MGGQNTAEKLEGKPETENETKNEAVIQVMTREGITAAQQDAGASPNIASNNPMLDNLEEIRNKKEKAKQTKEETGKKLDKITQEKKNVESELSKTDKSIELAQQNVNESHERVKILNERVGGAYYNYEQSLKLRKRWDYLINWRIYEAQIKASREALNAAKKNRDDAVEVCQKNEKELTRLKNKQKDLKEKVEKLGKECSKLQEEYGNLEKEYENLEQEYESLEQEFKKLEEMKATRNSEYEQQKERLQTKFNEFDEHNDNFQNHSDKLNTSIDKLDKRVKEHKKEIEDFQDDLEKSFERMKAKSEKARKESIERNQAIISNYSVLNEKYERHIQSLNTTEKVLRFVRDLCVGLAAGTVALIAASVIIPAAGIIIGGLICIGIGTIAGTALGAVMSAEEGALNGKGALNNVAKNLKKDLITSAVDSTIAICTLGTGKALSAGKSAEGSIRSFTSKGLCNDGMKITSHTKELTRAFSKGEIPRDLAKKLGLDIINTSKNSYVKLTAEFIQKAGGKLRPEMIGKFLRVVDSGSKVAMTIPEGVAVTSTILGTTAVNIATPNEEENSGRTQNRGYGRTPPTPQQPRARLENNTRRKNAEQDERQPRQNAVRNQPNADPVNVPVAPAQNNNQNRMMNVGEGVIPDDQAPVQNIIPNQNVIAQQDEPNIVNQPVENNENEDEPDSIIRRNAEEKEEGTIQLEDCSESSFATTSTDKDDDDDDDGADDLPFIPRDDYKDNDEPDGDDNFDDFVPTDENDISNTVRGAIYMRQQREIHRGEHQSDDFAITLAEKSSKNSVKKEIYEGDVYLNKNSLKTSNKISNIIANDITNENADDITDKVVNKATNEIADDITDKVVNKATNEIADDITDKNADKISIVDKNSNQIKNNLSSGISQKYIMSDSLCETPQKIEEQLAVLQELINQDFSSPIENFNQTLSSSIREERKENVSARSQKIEELVQNIFAKNILNTNEIAVGNNFSFHALKECYPTVSVLSSSQIPQQPHEVTTSNEQISFAKVEEKRDAHEVDIRDSSISQNEIVNSKTSILSEDIRKIEERFINVKVNIQSKRETQSLLFDEKIALKTRRELTLILKKLQKEDLDFFLIIMNQYKINDTIWKNEKMLKEYISRIQLLSLKKLYKVKSYNKLLKIRMYNTKIMLSFLITNLMICDPEYYKVKEDEIIDFLSSLDPVMIKIINPLKVFSDVLTSLGKSKYYEIIETKRKSQFEKLLQENLLTVYTE